MISHKLPDCKSYVDVVGDLIRSLQSNETVFLDRVFLLQFLNKTLALLPDTKYKSTLQKLHVSGPKDILD